MISYRVVPRFGTLAEAANRSALNHHCAVASLAAIPIERQLGLLNRYVSRMINLTTLAPDIVAAILDETLPPVVTL
jgi:hypothetical protein